MEKPQNGGSFVEETKDAHESHNFSRVELYYGDSDELYCLGFYETKSHGTRKKNTGIENISKDVSKKDPYVDDVLVVWCALHEDGTVAMELHDIRDADDFLIVYRNLTEPPKLPEITVANVPIQAGAKYDLSVYADFLGGTDYWNRLYLCLSNKKYSSWAPKRLAESADKKYGSGALMQPFRVPSYGVQVQTFWSPFFNDSFVAA